MGLTFAVVWSFVSSARQRTEIECVWQEMEKERRRGEETPLTAVGRRAQTSRSGDCHRCRRVDNGERRRRRRRRMVD